jgi:hypothetical protein
MKFCAGVLWALQDAQTVKASGKMIFIDLVIDIFLGKLIKTQCT